MESSATSRHPELYQALFLSPHLDDAVLSCGGTIHQLSREGNEVLIVTVMAGNPPPGVLSPYAERLHSRWQLASGAAASRRSEDLMANQVLGTRCQHLDIPDCIYRRSADSSDALYQSDEDIFGAIHPSETDLSHHIGRRLEQLPEAETVYLPLAIGNHVDHQLVRAAAERIYPASSIHYYEEYPYSESAALTVENLTTGETWNHYVNQLEPEDIETRIKATSCYRSQISTFFDSMADMGERILLKVELVGGERFWRRTY